MMYVQKKNDGFALLFVILAISVLAAATSSIATIAQRESFISNTIVESQRAFYAADTGLECGLYFMRKDNVSLLPFKCMTSAGIVNEVTGGSATQFQYPFDFSQADQTNPSCGIVNINTNATWTPTGGGASVTGVEIISRGYNKCTANGSNKNPTIKAPNTTDPTLLERRMVSRYVPGT